MYGSIRRDLRTGVGGGNLPRIAPGRGTIRSPSEVTISRQRSKWRGIPQRARTEKHTAWQAAVS